MHTTLQETLLEEAKLADHTQTTEVLRRRAELLLTALELLQVAKNHEEQDLKLSSYYQDQDSLTCETSHPT